MIKKRLTAKLVLSRETIRTLNEQNLGHAKGAATQLCGGDTYADCSGVTCRCSYFISCSCNSACPDSC